MSKPDQNKLKSKTRRRKISWLLQQLKPKKKKKHRGQK